MRYRAMLLVLAVTMLAGGRYALGDTLLLHDGRRIPGEVSVTADGYSVKTRFGTIIDVPRYDVKEWIKGNGAATTTSTNTQPATTTSTTTTNPAVSSKTPATTQATTGGRPAVDPRMVETLIRQGQDALYARDYKVARECFLDAVILEPRNVRAQHGMALTLMYLGDFKTAQVHMERALGFAGIKADRALILNNAMLQVALGNPMRAVKFIRDYLEPRQKEPDEQMLNALGAALFLADDGARRSVLWKQMTDLYVKYQKVVEATRPGQKRWGVEWLPVADVDRRMGQLRKQQAVADRILQQLELAESRVIRAKRELRAAQAAYARGTLSVLEVNVAQVNLTDKLTEFHRLAKAWDEAMDAVERPTWPRVVTPVALDDVTPPEASATALAMADPVYKQAMADASKETRAKRVLVDPDEPAPATKPDTPAAPPTAVVSLKNSKMQKVRVTQYAAAFAVAPNLIVTAAAPLENAVEFEVQTIEGASIKGEILKKDPKTGLALLKVQKNLAFIPVADAFNGGPITCACFPTVNLFNPMAELLNGIAGPAKEAGWSVKVVRHPRLLASPVIASGKVVGVVMATRDQAIDNLPAVSLEGLKSLLAESAGLLNPQGNTRDATSALMQLVAIREAAANE